MGQAIGVVFAILVGLVSWGITLAAMGSLSRGISPFGAAGSMEFVIFFTPIIAVAFPAALRRFDAEPLSGLWIIASAPLLGVLNFLLFFIFCAIGQGFLGGSSLLFVFATVLCVIPWAIAAYRNASSTHDVAEQDQAPPTMPSSGLRTPTRPRLRTWV